jgi:hypothetical protein
VEGKAMKLSAIQKEVKVKVIIGLLCLFSIQMLVASALGESFHFTVTSDPRESGKEIYGRVLESINSVVDNPGVFHVACGDYDFDLGGCRAKVNLPFGADFPWFGVVGNHDAENTDYADMNWLRTEYTSGHNGRTPLKSIFGAKDGPDGSKETTYSWDYGNAHFIILNCYWDGTNGPNADSRNHMSNYDANHPNYDSCGDIEPNLLSWLQEDLATNNKPFIFVFVHEPPFPYNHHVGDSLDAHPYNRDNFWSLLESEKVTAVFVGHIHYYFKHRGGGGPAPNYPGHTYCYSNDPNDWRTQDPAIDSIYGSVWEVSTGNAGQIPGGLKASPDGSCDMLEANRWNGVEFIDVNVTEDYAFINVYQDVNGRGPGSYTEPTTLGTQFTLADTIIPQSATVPVIYGYVLDSNATPLADVKLSASDKSWFDVTDADGYYEISVHYGWSGTITPAKQDYTFEPNGILYSNVTADIAEQNYTATYAPDFIPPEPDPMEWAVGGEPIATGPTSITMTAATATDTGNPPVMYYFECTNYGDASSNWQTNPTYVAGGLSPATEYTFRVKARDSSAAQNETEWSTEQSATTQLPPPEVSIIGSWVTGLTHAKETGTNRELIFIAHAERTSTSAFGLNSVTYGGQTMTKIIDMNVGSTGSRVCVSAFRLGEAGVTAATSGTFTTTWSATPSSTAYASVFLQNVNQAVPIGASARNGTTTGATITTSALANISGGMVIDAATCSSTGSYTVNNGFAEALEPSISNADAVDGYKTATGVAETPSVTHSTTTSRQVLIGFVVQALEAVLPPGQADVPSPANGATNVGLTTDLSWTAGSGATSHDVYFGTVSPPPFKVNQTATTYDTGTMSGNTIYYWRIDEINAGGTTTGNVWSFTTAVSAPTFVAAGTVTSGTGAITPALPSGIATGDILLLFLETSNQAISINTPNGGTWTAVTNSPQSTGTAAGSTGARLTVFWSRYNGTQGAPTTSDSGDHQLGRIIAVRGAVASGNPWDVTAGGVEAASDTSGSIPGATTTVANTLVVAAIATSLPDSSTTTDFSSWTNSNLTGLTERTDNTTSSGNGGGLGIATGTKATAGAYGNTAVTCASSAYKGMMSIAIKP